MKTCQSWPIPKCKYWIGPERSFADKRLFTDRLMLCHLRLQIFLGEIETASLNVKTRTAQCRGALHAANFNGFKSIWRVL